MTRQKENHVLRLCRAGILLALLSILSTLSVFWSTIPFSLSLFGVLLIGCFLPPVDALLALCAYLFLGAIGVPVFAGMRGGMDILLGPTGGFLLSDPLVAGGLSLILERISGKRKCGFLCVLLATVPMLFLCYLGGGLWYSFLYANGDLVKGFASAVLPFVPFDLGKAVLAAWLSVRLRRIAL